MLGVVEQLATKEQVDDGSSAALAIEKTNQIPAGKPQSTMDMDSSDSDSDVEAVKDGQPTQATERKRMQYAVFDKWKSNRAAKTMKEETRARMQSVDDEILSIRSLMTKQESNVIISDPREYQLELFEKAKNENIIAVLDTGSGKTLIAVLLLKHTIDRELEDRRAGKPRRIAFFLVDIATLVYQQFAVLECNLDQKIERFCGDMNVDAWTKSIWEEKFQKNMAIVCTADILYNCLVHSFIRMDQISLLIFDEAHHTKKNHVYARIIKDFYVQEEQANRPRIFGMTASPVDAKVDIVQAAKKLETLLHCKIATARDLSLVRQTVSRPEEFIIDYDPLVPPGLTPLCAELERKFGEAECLSKLFRQSKQAFSELGPWCADTLWSLALAEEEAVKLERRAEQAFDAEVCDREVIEGELRLIRQAKEAVLDPIRQVSYPTWDNGSFSSKVQTLKGYLDGLYEKPTEVRCIVFVKKRFTARLLAGLFKLVGSRRLRLAVLIGTRKPEAGDFKVTIRQQMLTLTRFRKGEINLLFATSIAEEGLDIPLCNVIIRFDMYDTLIQYIQSRGRARHKQSRYVHMLERGNLVHMQLLRDVQDGERVMRAFCESQPQDRLLQGNECDLGGQLERERGYRWYKEPSTGAKLTYGSALVQLAHFVASVSRDTENSQQALYIMSFEGRKYVCEVLLPASSPIRSVLGRPYPRKSIAKRSAAFEACCLLRKGKYLDEHLLPIYHKQLPAMRNARLALSLKNTNAYDLKLKPSIWETKLGTVPTQLYMTVLDLEDKEAAGRPHVPFGLLTRSPMPKFPSFPIFPRPHASCGVQCMEITSSLEVDGTSLSHLTHFTLRIYKDLFNKTFEYNASMTTYWIAPIKREAVEMAGDALPYDLIDWDAVKFVYANGSIPWTIETPNEHLADRFIVDPGSGGIRFFSEMVVPGMHALDPVPEVCVRHKYNDTILGYTSSLWKRSRERAQYNTEQPVIKAYQVPHRRNWLDDWDEKDEQVKTLAYVCPEPLKISALPSTVAAMGFFFPALISRLDSYLIALEACDVLGLRIQPHLALEAITKDSDNTEEHRNEQIHFQRGMGKNYERLEFIGDAFLKMATSISLFAQNASDDEFESHVKRMLMICNKNLFNHALEVKLYEYIRSQGFSRRTWYPEGLKLLEGKDFKKSTKLQPKHQLNDKTIADVCEALIGAALLSYRDSGDMDMAVKAVTVLVKNEDHNVQSWPDYYKLYKKPAYQTAESSASQQDLADQIFERMGYRFSHPRLLRSAFMHPSYPYVWERIPSYQRLEFLGDALLDMVCVNFLFDRHPDKDPQWLTEHKMAMVSNKFLGALCVRLGFHKHLKLYHNSLVHLIQEYVGEVGEAEAEAGAAPDYWTATGNPPKCLPDVVEAYVGALFVDARFDFRAVEAFFARHVRCYFEDMGAYDAFASSHPTTLLSNLLALSFGCTHHRVLADELPLPPPPLEGARRVVAVVMVHFRVVAEAEAASGRSAKVRASQAALELLDGLAPWEYRRKFGCDCKEGVAEDAYGEEGGGEAAGPARAEGEGARRIVPDVKAVEDVVGTAI